MTDTSQPAYDAFSSEYDRFVNWDNRLAFELPFLERQLTALGGPRGLRVLDAAEKDREGLREQQCARHAEGHRSGCEATTARGCRSCRRPRRRLDQDSLEPHARRREIARELGIVRQGRRRLRDVAAARMFEFE